MATDAALYWDLYTCPIPENYVEKIPKKIMECLGTIGKYRVVDLRYVYGPATANEGCPLRTKLEKEGFIYNYAPNRSLYCEGCDEDPDPANANTDKPSAPEILLRENLIEAAIHRRIPKCVILMTGDPRFQKTIDRLGRSAYDVVLIKPRAATTLNASKNALWD